jgi:hypothetical protein
MKGNIDYQQFIPITLRKRGIHVCAVEHTCLRPPEARLGSIGTKVRSRESICVPSWIMHLEKCWPQANLRTPLKNSLKVMTEAIEKNSSLYPTMSVISDHGSQFYAHKRDRMVMQTIHLKFF